eukprot:1069535-Pleurochrysis_carterae.AAC.1
MRAVLHSSRRVSVGSHRSLPVPVSLCASNVACLLCGVRSGGVRGSLRLLSLGRRRPRACSFRPLPNVQGVVQRARVLRARSARLARGARAAVSRGASPCLSVVNEDGRRELRTGGWARGHAVLRGLRGRAL